MVLVVIAVVASDVYEESKLENKLFAFLGALLVLFCSKLANNRMAAAAAPERTNGNPPPDLANSLRARIQFTWQTILNVQEADGINNNCCWPVCLDDDDEGDRGRRANTKLSGRVERERRLCRLSPMSAWRVARSIHATSGRARHLELTRVHQNKTKVSQSSLTRTTTATSTAPSRVQFSSVASQTQRSK